MLKTSPSGEGDFSWCNIKIKTDEAKVVAAVWGAEFVQFVAGLPILHWTILNFEEYMMNSSFSINHPGAIHHFLQKRPTTK